MNDIFSFRRFLNLLWKQLFEKRLFLLGFGVIVIFIEILIYFLTVDINQGSIQLQFLCLFLLLIISPTILVSLILNNFSDKKTSIVELLIPVSFFEKWLMIFIITFVIYLPSHLLILKLIDYSFVNQYRELAIQVKNFSSERVNDRWPYLSFALNGGSHFANYLLISIYLSGIFLLGTLYFKNLSYFKTALVVILLLTLLVYTCNYLTRTIIGESCHLQFNDFGAWINVQPRPFIIRGTSFTGAILTWFTKLILPVCIWLIAILRFREKEI